MTTPYPTPSSPYPIPLAQASPSYVPYVRRRNTPAQLDALQQLFEITPHPTRAQRQALANEFGMESKSVTNWFQNRRQTARRKSLSWNENKPFKTRSLHSPQRHRHKRASKSPLDRSVISLDHIAALSERPSPTSQSTSPRLPLTPRKSNVKRDDSPSSSELWSYMLSSPAIPPSSPGLEEARLAVLPSRAKTFRSLEWACLKARQKKWVDEDADELPTLPALERWGENEDEGTETETEEEEAITPESSVNLSPHSEASISSFDAKYNHLSFPKTTPQFEDMDAAITLLGFKTRSQL